jgi:hypothetical protein
MAVIEEGSHAMTDGASRPAGASQARAIGWLFLIVPLAAGLWLGHQIAYLEGERGTLYVLGWPVVVGGLALLLVVVGGIAQARRRPRIARFAFASAAAFVAATFAAVQLTNPLGLGYRPPVVLSRSGVATLTLDETAGFVPRGDAPVTCTSLPDSTAIGGVEGLDLGELGLGTFRGTVSHEADGPTGHIELFIDGADLAEGGPQPSWAGNVALRDLAPNRTAGTAAFEDLAYDDPEVSKGAPVPTGGPWPLTLSGTLHWDCAL